MIEGVIPQAHLQREVRNVSVQYLYFTLSEKCLLRLCQCFKQMSNDKPSMGLAQFQKNVLTCVPTVMLGIEEMPALDFGFLFLALAFSSIFFL